MDLISLERINNRISESINIKKKLMSDQRVLETILCVSKVIIDSYNKGGKTLFMGNGGSAADAQHLAAELSGKFYFDRAPLYAESLHVNTSYITAVANDYSYDDIFSRLVEAKTKKGDILIGLSTSGNSKNISNAFRVANSKDVITIGLTGEKGGEIKNVVQYLINVPSKDTPRIQEVHILVGHIICELVELSLFRND